MEMRERGLRRVGLGSSQAQGARGCGVLDLTEAPQQADQDSEPETQAAHEGEEEDGGPLTQETLGPGTPPTLTPAAKAEQWRKHALWAG
eukprot:1219539-Heterocapsa_arctica.AAC.1